MYSLAYNYQSVTMIVLGRAFIGIGGCRILSRKYIASIIPDKHKPKVASLFVCAFAVGMTLGPASSLVLSKI